MTGFTRAESEEMQLDSLQRLSAGDIEQSPGCTGVIQSILGTCINIDRRRYAQLYTRYSSAYTVFPSTNDTSHSDAARRPTRLWWVSRSS